MGTLLARTISDNLCNPPDCQTSNKKSIGPEPQYPFQTVQNQPYQLPNVQPTILTEMFKLIDEIETKSRRLRELVKDASAGRATPYLEQRRNFREPFPVLVPPSF